MNFRASLEQRESGCLWRIGSSDPRSVQKRAQEKGEKPGNGVERVQRSRGNWARLVLGNLVERKWSEV